jgi:excisionase family DNA binding protein
MSEHLRPKEAHKYLGIGLSTLWLYVKQGKIKAIKLSDRVTIFKKSDLDAFVTSREVE